jgi:pimeloyl-ACP methyl ester carboxylesterase
MPYVEQGDAAGAPVLLVHGYPDSWFSFERMLPHLPHELHAFSISQRGFGEAGKPVGGYLPRDFANDLALFLDAMELDAAVVVGHSMGATVVQQFAIEHPERALGMVGIGTLLDFPSNAVMADVASMVEQLDDPIDRAFIWEFQASTLAQPVPPEFLERIVDESMKAPALTLKAVIRGLLTSDLTDELGKITAPTLLIWGDKDELASLAEQRLMETLIPDCRLSIYAGAGHSVQWEEPALVGAHITAFIRSIGLS